MDVERDTKALRLIFVGLGMALKCTGKLEHEKMRLLILAAGASYEDFRLFFPSFEAFVKEIEKLQAEVDEEKYS